MWESIQPRGRSSRRAERREEVDAEAPEGTVPKILGDGTHFDIMVSEDTVEQRLSAWSKLPWAAFLRDRPKSWLGRHSIASL